MIQNPRSSGGVQAMMAAVGGMLMVMQMFDKQITIETK